MSKNNKQKYREFCLIENSIPIFSKDWWLDAVCGQNNWDVILVEKENQIVGALPYYIFHFFGKTIIKQPTLTQFNGVWLKYPKNLKYEDRLSYENIIMEDIIKKVESSGVAHYSQFFHYSFTNWLPFYWNNYKQTTVYTYVLENIKEHELILKEKFDYSKRKNIKKSFKIVKVKFDLSAEEFYNHHKESLKKQKESISYSYDIFFKIYTAVYARNAGKTIYAIDDDGNIHSALFIVWDAYSAYDLISTIDPDLKESGSVSLLVYEAIKHCSKYVDVFDFEGSMMKNVERSFRKFGAIQKPYFYISKDFRGSFLFNLGIQIFRKNKWIARLYRKTISN